VFLKDMNDFAVVNGIYEKAFGSHKPARSAVEVARLPKDVLVEVEAIARYVVKKQSCLTIIILVAFAVLNRYKIYDNAV